MKFITNMSINKLKTLSKEELIEKLKEAGILEAYIWGCGCCESPHIYFKGNDWEYESEDEGLNHG